MATVDFDFNLTRTEIVNAAFRICGVKPPGQVLSGDQMVQGVELLNTIVKEWQTEGVFLWTIAVSQVVFAVADYGVKTLGNEVLDINEVWYRESNGDRRMLKMVPILDFTAIYDQSSEDTEPTVCAVDRSLGNLTLSIWPTNSVNVTIGYSYEQRLSDMDTSTSNFDGPQHFIRALKYALAADLADEYRKPLNERNFLQQKAEMLFFKAKKSNVETVDEECVQSLFSYRS